MRIFRYISLACLTLGAAAPAQVVYVQQATPVADELAAEMRLLGANPTDVNAMVRAGELTLKLDDPTAASGFFARAERIDPSNPRIKAGKGSILVGQGRPNEALRQFHEAEMLRGDVRRFAVDRGLAYDLIGEQERAQRDYRLALKDRPADETLRRYALSLGISGKRDEALALIDQLLRRSDRGAWRTRAFILAMTGDSAGAERIATSMMPGGLAQGLQPFFDRLPRLGPIDRAFAVHFGEVRATPQRLADARMKPALPVLVPEAARPAPVVLAAVAPQRARDDRRTAKRGKRDRIDVASAAAPPVPLPLPQPPAYQGSAVAAAGSATPVYVRPPPSVVLASNRPVMAAVPPLRRAPAPGFTQPLPETTSPLPADAPTVIAADRAVRMSAVPVARQDPVGVDARPVTQPETRAASVVVTPKTVVVEPRPEPLVANVATLPPAIAAPTVQAVETPAPAVALAAVAPAPQAIAPSSATLPPAPGPVRGEDSILAKIIANITVPGSERDVEAVAPEPAPATVRVAAAMPLREPTPITAARATVPDAPPTFERQATAKAADDRKAADKALADKKLADRKVADKKIADAKKLADARKAAEEVKRKNDPKILEPSRIWVQVAGGANEGDLAKEWARVKGKAPVAFKGRGGWTTPLRATNRVLTGPFRTDTEARSFVNALSREGLSGFSFVSEAGQKVTRLGGK